MKNSTIRSVFGFLEWPWRRKQQRLMAKRKSYTKEDFLYYFRERGAPQQVIDEVWTALAREAVVEGFKSHPNDNIEEVFGLADEDKDEDLILALLHRCECRIPPTEEVLAMGRIDTVSDLVRFIVELRRQDRQ